MSAMCYLLISWIFSGHHSHKYGTMRINDLSDLDIMIRPMEDGQLRVTAQQQGMDIAHGFYAANSHGVWQPTMIWIAQKHRGQGIADLLRRAADQHSLEEANLGQLARAGALGAGLLGAGLGAYGIMDRSADTATPTVQAEPAQPNAVQAARDAAPDKISQDHPNFPTDLKGLDAKYSDTRVSTFKRVVLPLIDAENAEIRKQRQALAQLSKQKSLTKAQADWIEGMREYYKADDLRDLVTKVDIVPRSMALAQAAVESGWGQQPLAQQANVFYGQKTFDPEAPSATGKYGEKYRAFDSPQDSVRAYMRNLNTHPAYHGFRSARADLRKHNQLLNGARLVKSLNSYSTKSGYAQQLHSIIQARSLSKLDTK